MSLCTALSLTLLLSMTAPVIARASSDLPVFPGAQGFGTRTVAGRGGEVCRVYKLADRGKGTLRHCLEMNGPRVVVFEVGGVVHLKSPLVIEEPYLSVFGQTAPGDGIMVTTSPDHERAVLRIATHDVLIQHLRVRAGASKKPSCCRDAVMIANKKPGRVFNVVLDHMSMSWGSDEVLDIWYDSHDITVSRSIIAEGLHRSTNDKGPAGRGFVIGSGESHSISVHHNLFAHNYQRNPLIASSGVVDVVNNIVYHWTSRGMEVQEFDGKGSGNGKVRTNIVGNLFLTGTHREKPQRTSDTWAEIAVKAPRNAVEIYLEGNVREREGRAELPIPSQRSLVSGSQGRHQKIPVKKWLRSKRHPAPTVTEMPALALRRHLIEDVGATLPRQDSTDRRIFEELAMGTGWMIDCVGRKDPPSGKVCKGYNAGGWPSYSQSSLPRDRRDTDRDGIPDAWERRNGLDRKDADDGNEFAPSGYTWLETWVHSLSESAYR